MSSRPTRTGHPVLNPQGQTIWLSRHAIAQLRKSKLLQKAGGIPQISDRIFLLLHEEFGPLTQMWRRMLGADCSGPSWVDCHCPQCR